MKPQLCYVLPESAICPFEPTSCWYCTTTAEGCASGANTDVAGLGVLLAFFVTAGGTLLLAWFDYLLCRNGDHDKVFDVSFHRWLWTCFKRPLVLSSTWKDTSRKTILMLSDQLIVTGITVLIAGFAQSGTLSIYHFQVVTWLAWLASNAHQVTLGVLRNYLREHRTVLRYRLVAMGAIYVMLMCAVAFAGASILYSSFSSYTYALDSAVSCTWDAKAFRALPADTVFSLCVLSVSFTSRILKLFVTTSDLAEKYFRQKPGQWLKRQYYCAANPTPTGTVSAFFCRVKAFAIIVTYVNARAIFDTYTSDVFELIWLTLSFTYGSAQLFRWRSFTQGIINENSWSFGQLLAPLSLILPLLALPEVYADAKISLLEKHNTSQSSSTQRFDLSATSLISSHSDTAANQADQLTQPLPRLDITTLSQHSAAASAASASSPSALSQTRSWNRRRQKRRAWHATLLSSQPALYTSHSFRVLIFITTASAAGFFLYMIVRFLDASSGDMTVLMMLASVPPLLIAVIFFWLVWAAVSYACGAL